MPAHPEHYFSAIPASPLERRVITVQLAGRQVEVDSAAGVFSADRIDLGTSVLLRETPDPPNHGHLLDLGCGWGPLALTMASLSPDARVWGIDVNARALELLRDNARRLGLTRVRAAFPQDVPTGVTFAAIWSNPPIRIGKAALHEALLTWLPRLDVQASAYLVVQRNLGADSLHTWLTGTLGREFAVSRHASAKGFRVLTVERLAETERDPA